MYYLFYAGMALDKGTEQIGLALSTDGVDFRRAGPRGGLILPKGETGSWTELRTCNPVVLFEQGRFTMWYQGISRKGYAIGRAVSDDGVTWLADDQPCLTANSFDGALEPDRFSTQGVIEPCVLKVASGYEMYFMSYDAPTCGNRLHLAQSADGRSWRLLAKDLLRGSQLGDVQAFYPQIAARQSGVDLFLTLRRVEDMRCGMYRLSSPDGRNFSNLAPVWPAHDGLRTRAPRQLASKLPFARGRGPLTKGLRIWQALCLSGDPYPRGYAHTTFAEGEGTGRLYFHGYRSDKRGMRAGGLHMSIGLIEGLDGTPCVREVFAPADDPQAWDAFFVADPYILKLDDASAAG